MTDLRPRFIIACDVLHNMRWLTYHATELDRSLRGETLSEGAWEELCQIIGRLEILARKTRPRLPMAAE